MRDIIYNVLVIHYGRMYGYDLCEAMTEWIADRINNGEFKTSADIMYYVWMNTSGGGVAESASKAIAAALPGLIEDSDERTYMATKARR